MEYKGLIIGQCNRKESFFHLTCCKIWLPIWDVVFWAVRERRDNQKSQTYKPTNLLFLEGYSQSIEGGFLLTQSQLTKSGFTQSYSTFSINRKFSSEFCNKSLLLLFECFDIFLLIFGLI